MSNYIYPTITQAESAYRAYVDEHIKNVKVAFNMFKDIIYNEIILKRSKSPDKDILMQDVELKCDIHDNSKYGIEEFDQYRQHFYPSKEDDEGYDSELDYRTAWVHHYKNNPHHPEFWCCTFSNGEKKYIRMTDTYIFEMICDWISVSITKKNSVYDWWISVGKKEKELMMSKEDIEIINEFINNHKNDLNFSNDVN